MKRTSIFAMEPKQQASLEENLQRGVASLMEHWPNYTLNWAYSDEDSWVRFRLSHPSHPDYTFKAYPLFNTSDQVICLSVDCGEAEARSVTAYLSHILPESHFMAGPSIKSAQQPA